MAMRLPARTALALFLTAALAGPAMAAGDAKEGEKVFAKCRACHSLDAGKNGVGPSLAGVIGRKAGTLQGFNYSKAMTEKGIVWDQKAIASYVSDPRGFIPGNKMVFPGIKKDSEIENLLAFLAGK
jgi:cytochrome c2